jgi:hypothetical protein
MVPRKVIVHDFFLFVWRGRRVIPGVNILCIVIYTVLYSS